MLCLAPCAPTVDRRAPAAILSQPAAAPRRFRLDGDRAHRWPSALLQQRPDHDEVVPVSLLAVQGFSRVRSDGSAGLQRTRGDGTRIGQPVLPVPGIANGRVSTRLPTGPLRRQTQLVSVVAGFAGE